MMSMLCQSDEDRRPASSSDLCRARWYGSTGWTQGEYAILGSEVGLFVLAQQVWVDRKQPSPD